MFGVADIVEMVDMNGSRGEGYRWGGWHIFCDTERVGLEIRGYYNPLRTVKLNSFSRNNFLKLLLVTEDGDEF